MSGAKKIEPVFEDPINAKIQRKFDMVFNEATSKKANEDEINLFDDGMGLDNEMSMDNKKKDNTAIESPSLDLDFSIDEELASTTAPIAKAEVKAAKTTTVPGDDGLDFSLDFNMDSDADMEIASVASSANEVMDTSSSEEGFSLDGIEVDDMNFDESTKKTVLFQPDSFTKSNLEEFSLESSLNSTSELMSPEEARANIETTIKDILRPKFEDEETSPAKSLTELEGFSGSDLADIEDSVLDFGGNTPSQGFVLSNVVDDEEAFSIDRQEKPRAAAVATSETTGEFSIDSEDFDLGSDIDSEKEDFAAAPAQSTPARERERVPVRSEPSYETPTHTMGLGSSSMNTEDSMRYQATIRALREEREDFLAQIKNLKSETKELEQDNLTLKANLDEAKIEITILRKRHMVEVEDIKYRLSMTEEKKAMADEKARQADMRREKLEQKVRIDFNQVKQREKELESKLELLSMDVDSQVQSRDHKILELRRKIDALEFNMENASIKEQKSLDDKRKLEDRLNKIMKTLRHSIKNLEDDIDHAEEDSDHQKEKN